jgi:hypothetical protein
MGHTFTPPQSKKSSITIHIHGAYKQAGMSNTAGPFDRVRFRPFAAPCQSGPRRFLGSLTFLSFRISAGAVE